MEIEMSHRDQSHLKTITRARPVSLKPPIQHLLCKGALKGAFLIAFFCCLNKSNQKPYFLIFNHFLWLEWCERMLKKQQQLMRMDEKHKPILTEFGKNKNFSFPACQWIIWLFITDTFSLSIFSSCHNPWQEGFLTVQTRAKILTTFTFTS